MFLVEVWLVTILARVGGLVSPGLRGGRAPSVSAFIGDFSVWAAGTAQQPLSSISATRNTTWYRSPGLKLIYFKYLEKFQ